MPLWSDLSRPVRKIDETEKGQVCNLFDSFVGPVVFSISHQQ